MLDNLLLTELRMHELYTLPKFKVLHKTVAVCGGLHANVYKLTNIYLLYPSVKRSYTFLTLA